MLRTDSFFSFLSSEKSSRDPLLTFFRSLLQKKRENRQNRENRGKSGNRENRVRIPHKLHSGLFWIRTWPHGNNMALQKNFFALAWGNLCSNFYFFETILDRTVCPPPFPQYQCWCWVLWRCKNSTPTLILGGEGGLVGRNKLLDMSFDHDCLNFLKKRLSRERVSVQ